ncbi:MAG: PAS domain-containing sensor histidine kinase [Chitinophagaceae bacterium]
MLLSKEMYWQFLYKNPLPALIFDNENMQILEINDAAIEKYGYSRDEFAKLNIEHLHHAEDTAALMLEIVHCDMPEQVAGKLWRHLVKGGNMIIVEVTYCQVSYFGKLAMQAQVNDVTEKVRLQDELNLKHLQLTSAVLSAQESERKGIGEELHDNINQILATVQLSLGFALDHPDKRIDLILRSMKNTAFAIEEIRKLSKALIIPGSLKELGLVSSLEELIKDFLMSSKLKIRIYSTGFQENNVSEKQMIAIFRIVQEQLNNIIKHADASTVTIRLNKTQKKLSLLIIDNGKGFNTDSHRTGVGITNIINRAELFDGKVDIDSSPGMGCRLQVVLNIKVASQEAA